MSFKPDTQEYISMRLRQLLFDEKVADMVEKNGGEFPPSLFNNLFATESYPLDQERFDRVLAGYDTGLPPITVEKGMGDKYIVQNGRHRVAATILRGDDIVPCMITKKAKDIQGKEDEGKVKTKQS